MKRSYKMYLSAKCLTKLVIILFVVFQVMTVIVTLERYKHIENLHPTEFFARSGRDGDGSAAEATSATENALDAWTRRPATTTTTTTTTTTATTRPRQKHSRNDKLLTDSLRKLMLEKLGILPDGSDATRTSDDNPFEVSPTENPSSTSDMLRRNTSTTEEPTADEVLPASIPPPETTITETRETTSPHPTATTANETHEKKRKKHFSLMNIIFKVVQSVGKMIESKTQEQNPEVSTQAFSLKGLLAFSSEYDTEGVIRSAGYPVETHKVRTEDGYILTLHRIPPRNPPLRPAHAKYLPVFLQHGLWSSSYHWFKDKPQYTLPLLLADKGYDVWLGNSRGNVISQEHVYLSIDTNSTYWDFSFHEMGIYDLPAVIEHILAVTKKPQIHYIGHSMGTTMFFVMASLRPDVARKVHFMLALAPIATVGPIRTIFRWVLLMETFFLTREKPLAYLARVGISLKTILHYMQLYVTGKFEMYDYGKIANMDIYRSPVPPSYDLAKVSVPTVLCYGTKDTFLTSDDIETLDSSLGNSLGVWPLPLNHFQFPSGKITKEVLYRYIPLHLH